MRLLARLAIGLLFAIPAFGQGVRVGDGHIAMTTKKVGALNVLVPVPDANIQFCAYPNIGVPCVNLVTTYTDDTLGTSCPTTTQVTISGSNVCQATTDAQGNWGVWVPASGNYSFTITSSAGVFGPYYVTAGGGGGGGGSGTPASPLFSLQFNNAGAFGGATGFNYFNSSIAPNGTALISNYDDDTFSTVTPADIQLNGNDGLTSIDLLANNSNAHVVVSNNTSNTPGALNSITHGSGSTAILGQAISPDAGSNALTGVNGKAFVTGSGSTGRGVLGGAFNSANGGGAAGASLYGVDGFVNLFNPGSEAFTTMAALRARGDGTSEATSPTANNIYGLVIENMTPVNPLYGTVSNTEQAALKIKAQTLSAALGAKYGIKVDTGAGENQFDTTLRLNAGLKDSTGSKGTSGWFLSTDGTNIVWAPGGGGGGAVSSWNTRVGAVVPANLDYTFGQLSAALNSNAGTFGYSGNTFNASAAAHTLPAVTGTIASIPATCAVGEVYFANDATIGRNDYHCVAANTWVQSGWTNQMTTMGDTQPGGASGIPIRVGGVTSPDGLPFTYSENSTAGVAQTPVWRAPTYPERNITGTTATDTIVSLDCWPKSVDYQGSVAVAVTLPTATTLGVNNCHFKLTNNTSGSATAVTVTPTTWTIQPGGASLVIAQGQTCDLFVSAAPTRWDADCHDEALIAGTNITITRGQFGPTITASSTAATAFSALTTSTNTTAAMLVGAGASLGTTSTGTIGATSVGGITVTGTPSVGQVLTATSTSAANWQAGGGGGSGTWAGLTLSGTNTGTSMVLAPTSTTNIPLTINAPTGQTSDIFDVNLNSVRKFWIDSTGSMNFAGTNLNVGSSTSTTAAIVAAHGGNTTSLPGCLQVYNNADTQNANLCASGTMGRTAMQAGIATADTVQNYVLKSPQVNPQAIASYAILATDFGNLVTRSFATAMTDTIARAGAGTTSPAAASFGAGWFVDYCVLQTSPGSATIQATTSTFSSNGLTLLTVAPGTCTRITSNGTNYINSMSTAISLSRATIGVGNCASGVSSTWWNTSLVAVCRTGSNIIESILPFADTDTAQIPQAIDLPADWLGAVDVKAIFSSPSTTGTVIFNVATSCAASNGTVTDDVAFNAADALSTVTLGGTANAQWASSKSGITTTGCAAGSTMQLKITRATDTAAGVANLKNIEVTLRRTNLI